MLKLLLNVAIIIATRCKINVRKNKDYYYFVCWTPKSLEYEKINKDIDFFNNAMLPKLHNFNFNY